MGEFNRRYIGETFIFLSQTTGFYISCKPIPQETTIYGYDLLEMYTLRKHAYLNILKIFPQKNENFQIKISDIFHISAQNTDFGYSLEPPR